MLFPRLSRTFAFLSPVAFALILLGCSKSEAQQQTAAPAPQMVTAVTLIAHDVTLKRELPGRAVPSLIAEVRPQVSGIVKKRLFTEGGPVKAGQPLYQLDESIYATDVASAKAALARAQAALKTAELNARRSAELVKIDAVSRQDDENAQSTLAQAKADVEAAKAALRRSQVLLEYARIESPISGRIGKSTVTQGALVTANQADPLASVQRLDPMYIDLTQSSTELLQLRQELAAGKLSKTENLPVEILLEDGSVYKHKGKLAFADVTVDPTTGSYSLRITVPNPDDVLLPGMYVRAVIGNGIRQDAILVPQQGIARDPKGNTSAMVVNKQGIVEARPVKVNRTIGDKWLVDGGLVVGDRVIVEGLQKIRPGAKVNVAEAGQSAPAPAAFSPAKAAQKDARS